MNVDKPAVIYWLKNQDLEHTKDTQIYAEYCQKWQHITKTMFTRLLRHWGFKRVSARRGGQIIKIYRYVGTIPNTKTTCPLCSGKGYIKNA